MNHTSKYLSLLTILFVFVPTLLGGPLQEASPESVGLSADRLERITALMRRNVEEDRLAGAVALVARDGKVAYLESVGMRDRENGEKMTADTIFRIASMTKPITSVAVMMLYEEGHFQLGDPVSKYLPAFENMKVLNDGKDASSNGTIDAKRPITIRHLLTHTSGLTYHWDPRVGEQYAEAGINHGLRQDEDPLAHDMENLADQPLVHQPGEAWTYGLSVDVLGRLVEVVSGLTLDEFFRTRIFEPLGMNDTHFYLPKEKVSRLAAVYGPDSNGGLRRLPEGTLGEGAMSVTITYPYERPRHYYAGGAGLSSTVMDYARFCQMLLNGGQLDGARLLSPETVTLMTTDHVGDLKNDSGFGLGFSVVRSLREAGELTSVGTYGWGGFWYTTFLIDPQEHLLAISMAQVYPSGNATLNDRLGILAHQAIVEPLQ